MAFKPTGKSFGRTPNVGESIEGYLIGFKESQGLYGVNKNPVIKLKDSGEELVLNENGNLKYMLKDIQEKGGDVGCLVKITREPDYLSKKTNKMSKRYEVLVDDEDRIEIKKGA